MIRAVLCLCLLLTFRASLASLAARIDADASLELGLPRDVTLLLQKQAQVRRLGELAATKTCSEGAPFADGVDSLTKQTHVMLCHEDLAVAYSKTYKNPLWVAYELEFHEQVWNAGGRKGFTQDPLLKGDEQTKVGSSAFGPVPDDVAAAAGLPSGSYFDRGHLAPSYSLSFDKQAWKSSYYMSNAAPQAAQFNRVSWRLLEEHITDFVVATGTKLQVLSGTAYATSPPVIEGTAIPSHFWKAICAPDLNLAGGIYGKNVNSNVPEGMGEEPKLMPLADLLEQDFMRPIFLDAGQSDIGDRVRTAGQLFEACGADAGTLDIGDRSDQDSRSDEKRKGGKGGKGGKSTTTPAPVECHADGALILWQYLEGHSYDKLVTVKNVGAASLDLEAQEVEVVTARNGRGWGGTGYRLTGVLSPGATLTIAHPKAEREYLAMAKLRSGWSFNGDDAVGLRACGGEVIDVLGEPEDSAATDLKDCVLHRKDSTPCLEWASCSSWEKGALTNEPPCDYFGPATPPDLGENICS